MTDDFNDLFNGEIKMKAMKQKQLRKWYALEIDIPLCDSYVTRMLIQLNVIRQKSNKKKAKRVNYVKKSDFEVWTVIVNVIKASILASCCYLQANISFIFKKFTK